jgi:hypothetical protein
MYWAEGVSSSCAGRVSHKVGGGSSTIGGLLEWDMWAWIDGNRLARPHKYASIGPQIRLSRVAIGLPPRYQQTTAIAVCDDIDPRKPWVDERLRSCCDKRFLLLKYATSANSVPPMKPLSFPYRTCAAEIAYR